VDNLANLSGEVFMEYCGYPRVFEKRNVGSGIVFEKMRKDMSSTGRSTNRCKMKVEERDMFVVIGKRILDMTFLEMKKI
jgi:hypothetical protein